MSSSFLLSCHKRALDASNNASNADLRCPDGHPLLMTVCDDEMECDRCNRDIPLREPHLYAAASDYAVCTGCSTTAPDVVAMVSSSAGGIDMDELADDLIYAGRIGDVDEMRQALTAGAPVDCRDDNGSTSLMMAAANGHVGAMEALLAAGADVNALNERRNTALHWAVHTGQEAAVTMLCKAVGINLFLQNERGCTAAMEAERAGKGELVVLILAALDDEDAAAIVLGHGDEDEQTQVQRVSKSAGVDKTLDGRELRTMGIGSAPAGGHAALPATRGVLSGETLGDAPTGAVAATLDTHDERRSVETLDDDGAAEGGGTVLELRERPEPAAEIVQRVGESAGRRTGDWRYSVMPAVVPHDVMLTLSRDFFMTTELLNKEGNTFGPDFEEQYAGHRNYFYFMNRNKLVAGAEPAAFIFERLDAYTRQVVELHHPGVPVRLERAFGAYYEGGRDGFHLGVNEHCDGDANLVSTVVHATLPDGDVGFHSGGELTISAVDELSATPITHSNETIGSVVYLGGSIFHHASPIEMGGKRLVFCMFYACDGSRDLSKHALA